MVTFPTPRRFSLVAVDQAGAQLDLNRAEEGGTLESGYFLGICRVVGILRVNQESFLLYRQVRVLNIYIYGYWVVSGPHGTAFINCTCMFEGSYIYLPSTHIYQRHS